jgi:histidinol-phosphate aminotransferase
MNRPQPRANIREIAAYVHGEKSLEGIAEPIVLASNESPLGASPHALAAARAALDSIHLYPDPTTRRLRLALAARYGLDPDWILCGSGSESLIEIICRTYAGPGDEVLMPEFSFPMYGIYARTAGATPLMAPAPGYTADVDALLAAVTPRTRIVFIANPNNPTGTWVDRAALARLADGLPESVLLVIDSAYAEYVGDPRYDEGLHYVEERPGRVMVLDTFSKLYALATLRIGWGHADPEMIDHLLRARTVFPVSIPGEAAAVAALADADHVQASLRHNARWRPWLAERLAAIGMEVCPSGGNFVFARHGNWGGIDAQLRRDGIIVRPVPPAGGLRITVGTEPQMRSVDRSLQNWRAART